jgi:hypothetical protein
MNIFENNENKGKKQETFKNQVGIKVEEEEVVEEVEEKENITIEENTDKIVRKLEVYESNDYSKFVFLPENRPVIKGLVARLIASMQKETLFDYILVTKDSPVLKPGQYGVVDGQHRLKAREYLGLPIHYVILENYNVKLIIGKNTHKAWTEMNFINCYAKMGNDNYNKILKLKESYPEFKHTRLYVLLAMNKFVADNGFLLFKSTKKPCMGTI